MIRIGGSVIASPPNVKRIKQYAEILQKLRTQGHKLVVIVGGGSSARKFIQLAKDTGLSEPEQDEIAISISRIFAQLIALKLGGLCWKTVPTSIEQVIVSLADRGIVVMGGLRPGMTTDAVAALVASEINAKFIVKATDQDGVYTKDPKWHPDAKKIDVLSINQLSQLLEADSHEAGIHQIIDPEAIRILKKNRTKTIIVNGLSPENLVAAINGKRIGTIIQ